MKPKSVAPQSAVMAVDRKLHNTWVYIKRHWQLYLLFLMPAVLLTLVFRYIPMGGVLIAFQKIQPVQGHLGQRMGRVQELYAVPVLAGFHAVFDQHLETERLWLAVGLPHSDSVGLPAQPH